MYSAISNMYLQLQLQFHSFNTRGTTPYFTCNLLNSFVEILFPYVAFPRDKVFPKIQHFLFILYATTLLLKHRAKNQIL